jgi:uncharacterized protein HemY
VLTAQGNLADAEPLFRQALEIQKARDPKAAPTTQTVARLADLLDKTNRPEEAAAVRAEYATTRPAATNLSR